MNNLVLSRKEDVYCDSRVVAKKFGKKHHEVMRVIEKLVDDISKLRAISNRPKYNEILGEYRGQTFTYYEMNREFFSLLAMRFKTKRAFEWQIKFNDAFYDMEKRLIQSEQNRQSEMYLTQRNQSKQIRREETDIIKDFVEYAEKQGSQHAKFYYKHITNAVYQCLGLVQYQQPKLRETLDLLETNQLIMAEITAKNSLIKYMNENEHYKAIFSLVKKDLEAFAKFIVPTTKNPNAKLLN